MKKSEFVGQYKNAIERDPFPHHLDIAMLLAEKAGVQWDPEEPELPERLEMEVEETGVLIEDQLGGVWLDLTIVDTELPLTPPEIERVKELLARYNAWGRLTEYAFGEARNWVGARGLAAVALRRQILDLLHVERERLQ